MSTAWLTGATGAWGRAFARALLDAGYDVLALGRRDAPDLELRAAELGRGWGFVRFDLAQPPTFAEIVASAPEPFRSAPDVLVHAAVAIDGDRGELAASDYLAPAALLDSAIRAMRERGSGRIGVLVAQNARLGLAGLGDYSAAQGALWTWSEARREELRATSAPVSLTVVIPPRAASPTQRFVAERSGHGARLAPPDATRLLRAVLAGHRRAGRRPLLAALAMIFR